MFKRMFVMLLIVGTALGGIFAFKSFQGKMIKKYMSSAGKQAQTVSTVEANLQDWRSKIEAVGTLRAVRGVDVSSEVSGLVEELHFDSGDQVKAGALLVRLRANDDMAALASLQADQNLAELTYNRDLKQLNQHSVAQALVDLDLANLEKAKAMVAEQKAKIEKKFIRAPFSGNVGIRQIDLGQYLSPGSVIVTLQELDPIFCDFYLPQQELANIKIGQELQVTNDLHPDKIFSGKIWAINSKVDTVTRNVLVRASLDNQENILLPGMYAMIDIDLGNAKKYITVPQTAITYNPFGNTVFLVKSDKTKEGKQRLIAQQQFVTLGPTRGDQVAILSGIAEGDMVVSTGQIKLQNGTELLINNTVVPLNESNPKPNEN